jgi:hypothetical protein
MYSKSAFGVLAAALTAIFIVFLRETYWAVLVDIATDHLAEYLGIERAKMIAAAAPFVVAFMAASVVVAATYRLGMRDRALKPKIEILYDPTDINYVRPITGLYGPTGEFYSIGINNKGSATIYDITLRALDSWFSRTIIFASQNEGHSTQSHRPVLITHRDALHPHAPEPVQLFGLNYHSDNSHPDYITNTVQRFTLEITARDSLTVREEFEYDPKARPMLRMLNN